MCGVDAKRVTVAARDERGFTIVETVVATFLLLVGLLSMIGVFDDSRDQNATGERGEIALMQAEQALEEMRGVPYAHLMLDAGAVDPTGGQRVLAAGAELKVKPDLSERLVYYSTEGKPQSDAWVPPTSSISVGTDEAPLDMTVHRFVTWRDEECGVLDLSNLGVSLPGAIDQVQVPLNNLVNNLINQVLGLVGSNPALSSLKTRLQRLQTAIANRETQISAAIAGISQLDLCDANVSLLNEVQKLSLLTPRLGDGSNQLTDDLQNLEDKLSSVCVPLLGCLLGQAQQSAITGVNSQLDCMFGTGSQQAEFDAYLDGVLSGVQNLAGDLSDTDRNSKRITVAVVVEPRNGVGPMEPVWATSVVRDPGAGLLTSGGATLCTA